MLGQILLLIIAKRSASEIFHAEENRGCWKTVVAGKTI
jgi:hypothetical protein